MYELVPESDSIIVTFRAIGILSDSDYDSLSEAFEAIAAEHAYVRVLVDWEKLEGWDEGAKTSSAWFGRSHHDRIQRMAIVADDRWTDECSRVKDNVAPTEVRAFTPSNRDAAMAWLKKD